MLVECAARTKFPSYSHHDDLAGEALRGLVAVPGGCPVLVVTQSVSVHRFARPPSSLGPVVGLPNFPVGRFYHPRLNKQSTTGLQHYTGTTCVPAF
jgi:hypothetical protein